MRYHNWQVRFEAFINSRMHTPFAWGTNDCAVFACDCVLAITGQDFGMGLREHRTAKEASDTLENVGGVVGIADRSLGARIVVGLANVGDVILLNEDGRDSLAICNGGTVIAVAKSGLTTMSMSKAVAAWRVI